MKTQQWLRPKPPVRGDVSRALELQAEGELDMSFASCLSACNNAEIRVLPVVVRQDELRGIGDVESFSPELQFPALGELEALGDGEVHIAGGRAVVCLQSQ